LTEYGWLEDLQVPQVRGISFHPSAWDRYKKEAEGIGSGYLGGFFVGAFYSEDSQTIQAGIWRFDLNSGGL